MSTVEPKTKLEASDVDLHNRMRLRRERRLWIAGILASIAIGWALATFTMSHHSEKVVTEPNPNCPGVFSPNGTPLQTPSGNVKPKSGARGMSFGTGVGTSVPTQPGTSFTAPSARQAGYSYETGPSNAPSGTGAGGASGPGGTGSGAIGGTYGMNSTVVVPGGQTATGEYAGNGITGGGSLAAGTNGVTHGGSLTIGGNGVTGIGSLSGGNTAISGIGSGAIGAGTGIGGTSGFSGGAGTGMGGTGMGTGGGGHGGGSAGAGGR